MAPRKQAAHRRVAARGPRRPRFNITMAPELADRLRAEARETEVAVSWIIEDLLKAHFDIDADKKVTA